MDFNLGSGGLHARARRVFYDQIVERVGALPGVRGAAIAQSAPLAGGISRSVFPEGADTTTRDRILVQVNTVGLGYFQTIGIPIVRGRDFTRADTVDVAQGRRHQPDDGAAVLEGTTNRSASASSSSATTTTPR